MFGEVFLQFCCRIVVFNFERRFTSGYEKGLEELLIKPHLFEVINSKEDALRMLIWWCVYLRYVEARPSDQTLFVDEILKDGFCLNIIDTPLCPLKVVTNLQEANWDVDIMVNSLPFMKTRGAWRDQSILGENHNTYHHLFGKGYMSMLGNMNLFVYFYGF